MLEVTCPFGPSIFVVKEILFTGRFLLLTTGERSLNSQGRNKKFILTDNGISK